MSAGNPVTEGLFKAFQIANVVQRQRMAAQEMELATRREERQQRLQEADLQMRLDAIGARALTPSDDLEAQTGKRIVFGSEAGVPTSRQEPSDLVNRIVKVGQNRYVLPSEQDKDAKEDKKLARNRTAAVEQAKAVGGVQTETAVNTRKSILDQFGVAIGEDMATKLGLPVGFKVLPEQVDDLALRMAQIERANRPAATTTPSLVHTTDDAGTVHFFDPKTGAPKATAPGAGKKKAPPQPKDNSLEMARVSKAKASSKATEIFNQAGGDPKKAEQLVVASTDPDVKAHSLEIVAQLRGLPKQKDSEGNLLEDMEAVLGDKPAATTPAAAPKKPSKGKVTADQVKRFARAKKVDYRTALKEFRTSGYETPE